MKLVTRFSLLMALCFAFVSKAQEADTTAHDLFSEGFKAHAFVINMTDIAKVTDFKKPFIMGVNGAEITIFTKENKWWKGGMFSLYALNTFGDNATSDYVGDWQMFSNIESFPDTNNHINLGKGQLNYRTFIYNLYYQHFFKKSRLLVGQYDLNMDFAFSNVGLNFMNSSFGLQPTIAFNVPVFSTFPFTNLTARYEYNFDNGFNFRAAVAQGYGGNQLSNPHGTKYQNSFKDGGLFAITEVNRHAEGDGFLASDYKLGVWMHSGTSKSMKFPNLVDSLDTKNHLNYGAYLIADKFLWHEKGDSTSTQGLYGFVDLGWAPKDYNFFNYYIGGGLSYSGLIPNRPDDIFSIGYAGPMLNKGVKSANNFRNEGALEINYNWVTEHVNIQPCVQFISNTAGSTSNYTAFMIRFTTHNGVFY
jgi:porin